MEQLAKKVTLGTFRYSQMKRVQAKHTGKHIAIYRADCKTDSGKLKHIGYEVIIIQLRKEATFHTPSKIGADGKRKKAFDTVVPEHEAYPGTGDFGRNGWYYRTLQEANNKFDELINALPHNSQKPPEPVPEPKIAQKRVVLKVPRIVPSKKK